MKNIIMKGFWIFVLAIFVFAIFVVSTECHAQDNKARYEADSVFSVYSDSTGTWCNLPKNSWVKCSFPDTCYGRIIKVTGTYLFPTYFAVNWNIIIPMQDTWYIDSNNNYLAFQTYGIKFALWLVADKYNLTIK